MNIEDYRRSSDGSINLVNAFRQAMNDRNRSYKIKCEDYLHGVMSINPIHSRQAAAVAIGTAMSMEFNDE
jgi:hypothetical protein